MVPTWAETARLSQLQHEAYGPLKDDSTCLCFKVWNIGTERTTINNVALYGYKTWWHRVRQKHGPAAVVPGGGHGQSAPYVLEVGKEVMTLGRQDEKLEKWTREYRLYGAVYHSFSKRPLLLRIKPIRHKTRRKRAD
jgi:hypothetical protein